LLAQSLWFSDSAEKNVPAMPGSPVDGKTHSRPTVSVMPPLPSVNPSGPRPAAFSTTALTNGINHSPPMLNAIPSPPQRYSNGPSSSSSSSLANQQLPATCGARQLSKLKRFLTTLQQFGNDISPEIGESVRNLVLALVNSTVTIEEFHSRLQEATNFPLRPFVIPFLKVNEILVLVWMCLENILKPSKPFSSDIMFNVFLENGIVLIITSNELSKENGFHERPPASLEPPAKRICTISPAPRHSPAHPLQLPAQMHPTPPPLQHYALDDISTPHLYREPQRVPELKERPRLTGSNGGFREEPVDHRLTDREWAEEWRHLDHVLNCIVDMVEKTRRSVSVLRRCQESDREELNYWRRRSNPHDDGRKNGSAAGNAPFSKTHSPLSAEGVNADSQRDLPLRAGSGYVPDEIWRKAEEAVNEVKRQAMDEVQKAVADAEQKAFEMITTERAKMEKTLAEAKRKATEDAIQVINEQEDSSECCWNCGRKASETCSGCNAARYCGSFCQHKDWERHHLICSPGLQAQPKSMPRVLAKAPESGPVPSPGLEKTSRASTPASSSTPDASGH
uniref:CBFA2/RUNX1 partner transcriptional co-repressor 2 n=1 Tax=Sinocyclocheilus grahami TaxID=75366 RepID=A0A672NHE4_SINGR